MDNDEIEQLIKSKVRDVPDYPKRGITFKDITPLLADASAFRKTIDALAERMPEGADSIVGIESRGFIIGSALSYKLGLGFVPIRKKGKLPYDKISVDYTLEYGKETMEMHRDAISPGDRVVVVDDLLATGGTSGASAELISQLGGSILSFAFMIELVQLNGRERLKDFGITALARYV